MTGHPEEPPFQRFKPYYLILKLAVLAAAVVLTLKLLGFF